MPDDSADPLHQRVRAELEALDLDPRTLPTPALRAAIRGRRRASAWGAAGAGVLLAAGAATVAVTLLPSGQTAVVLPGRVTSQEPTAAPDPIQPRCGQPIRLQPGIEGLRNPSTREALLDGPGILELTVTLTNPTRARLRGTAGHVDVTVVQDGRIVALPSAKRLIGFPVDLAPGASMTLTGGLALQDCRAGTRVPAGSGKRPLDPPPPSLPAGSYQLYAEVDVLDDAARPTPLHGGPWPLTLH